MFPPLFKLPNVEYQVITEDLSLLSFNPIIKRMVPLTAGPPLRTLELMGDLRIPPTNLVFFVGSVPVCGARGLQLLLCWCITNYSSWYHILHLPFSFDKPTIINYDQLNKSIRHSADVSSTIQTTECWISGSSRRSWFVEFHSFGLDNWFTWLKIYTHHWIHRHGWIYLLLFYYTSH